MGSIPGSGRSPGGGNGKLLQYSCQENLKDRGAWWATLHRVAKSGTQLSMYVCTLIYIHTHTHTHTHIYIYIKIMIWGKMESKLIEIVKDALRKNNNSNKKKMP